MSIFRETFPDFISEELSRRQRGMQLRDPKFIHQLTTRSSWVRMTSAVNYNGSDELARKYVLQGGTLDKGNLRKGIGKDGTFSYDILSPGGQVNRMGIRPMPGISNISISTKGAYGSLQEATVNFVAWDIKQLEELEMLYMRPGYTVLLEFGWDYVSDSDHYNTLPKYDIFNRKGEVPLNDMFKEIYSIIKESKGTYDALIGYVKNYGWSAREDGGYDCTTSIISVGEVLESLKCNYVPIDSDFFNVENGGILKQKVNEKVISSYELGILPGLLHEMWEHMRSKTLTDSYSGVIKDPKYGNSYHLFMSTTNEVAAKNDRGGYAKPLGTEDKKTECWITLGSFCELLTNYIIIKTQGDKPLSPITTYQTDEYGEVIKTTVNDYTSNLTISSPKSLECIASPLSISTNYGICFVRNDNWESLKNSRANKAKKEDTENNPPKENNLPNITIQEGIKKPSSAFSLIHERLISPNTIREGTIHEEIFTYKGDIEQTLNYIASEMVKGIVDIEFIKEGDKLKPKFIFFDGSSFLSRTDSTQNINLLDFFNPILNLSSPNDQDLGIDMIFRQLFNGTYGSKTISYNPFDSTSGLEKRTRFKDITNTSWTKELIISKIKKTFTSYPSDDRIQELYQSKLDMVKNILSQEASRVPGLSSETLMFLTSQTNDGKCLGSISNIYVNINYLYSQAVSKNMASSGDQNSNNISLRNYLQSILRDIQNSLGNINDFDIQVDNRNSIGRIVDLNYTGRGNITPFTFQLHNVESIIRNYSFQSKIFPEMGSIIAISAQDSSGIGKLGYDNATLIAWNDGITDRLIPKKDFIQTGDQSNPLSFILPFLTKMFTYFLTLQGQDTGHPNYQFGGMDFAYRDFLSNLNKIDKRNSYKAIIPTELSMTMDGIGGMIIGNLFQINQDIVPRGYRNGMEGQRLAYIVTKIGHSIEGNDWTTEIGAYPIILEESKGTNIMGLWDYHQYGLSSSGESRPALNKSSSNTISKSLLSTYDKAEEEEPGFKEKVQQVAKNIGVDEMSLVKIMYKESGISASMKNSIGCVGLIQFCPDNRDRKTIGGSDYLMSTIGKMTRIEQLDLVEKYFKSHGFNSQKHRSIEDLYLATLFPIAIDKPWNYILGIGSSDPEYKFKIAEQNPTIAQFSKVLIDNRKVINVAAISYFINN